MSGKVIAFDANENVYIDLAERAADEDRFEDAVSYAYSAWEKFRSKEAAKELGFLYADMKLYALSDKYWFYFLERAKESEAYVAFEELMLNHYYRGDVLLTNYYFKERLERLGDASEETCGENLVELALSKEETSSYRIVYPPELADYSKELKSAKQCMAANRFGAAAKLLEKVPSGAKQYRAAQKDLAAALFEMKNDGEATETCKRILDTFGDDAVAYCILSRIADSVGDEQKSGFYYEKAISVLDRTNFDDTIKVAACAIERDDRVRSAELLEIVLREVPYNTEILLTYAQTLINSDRLEEAKNSLKKLVKIDPFNVVYKYYLDLCSDLLCGEREDELPVPTEERIPFKRERQIKKILSTAKKKYKESGASVLKKPNVKKALIEGTYGGDFVLAHDCVSMLTCLNDTDVKNFCADKLMDERTIPELKQLILYLRVLQGGKKKISFSSDGVFIRIKPYKLPSLEKDSELYVPYAYVLSKLTPVEDGEQKRLATVADKVLKNFTGDPVENVRELSAIITAEFLGDKITPSLAARMFCVEEKAVRKVAEGLKQEERSFKRKKKENKDQDEGKNN